MKKIKSHMTPEQYAECTATFSDVVANEVADRIAQKAAEGMQGYRNIDTAKIDNGTYNLTKHIARRISIIENHCWRKYDSKRQAVQRPKVSRKKELDTGFYDDHDLYQTITGRIRCTKCRGVAANANKK